MGWLTKVWLACGVLIIATPATASIVNGSFETPVVPNGGFTTFSGGSSFLGWDADGPENVAIVDGDLVSGTLQFTAQDGNQWMDLTGIGTGTATGISQTLSTVAGGLYTLSFYVGSGTDGLFHFPSTVDLSINGDARSSYSNPNSPTTSLDWMQFTVPISALGATTITFYNGDAGNNLSALDNVSLQTLFEPTGAVPEPGTWIVWGGLCALGLAAMYFRRAVEQQP